MNTCKKIMKRFQVAKSHGQCVRYPIIIDRKYFELLWYGSYKSFIIQSRQIENNFKLMTGFLLKYLFTEKQWKPLKNVFKPLEVV